MFALSGVQPVLWRASTGTQPATYGEGLHTVAPYYQKILEPVLRSEARRVLGKYTPEEIYSSKRDVIEREIR